MGSEKDCCQEARVLNRIIRVTSHGWEMEADQRHADILVQALGLSGAKSVTTPGEQDKSWEEVENKVELSSAQAHQFRQLAARANYLAMDRPDIQYATKEVCRAMARPTRGDWRKLKRIARYLIGHPRLISRFDWQLPQQLIRGYSDSD